MVTVDTAQLSQECNDWLSSLRNKRESLIQYQQKLQHLNHQQLSREELPQVDHYNNQFDIQLANINHLKHQIKEHDKTAVWEQVHQQGTINDNTWAVHEALNDQVQTLQHTLDQLQEEFSRFIKNPS